MQPGTGRQYAAGYTPPPPYERRKKDLVTYPCEDCGTETTRNRTGGEPYVCAECGITRGIQAALEMARKEGPAYDKWLSSRGPSGRPVT
jgi:DNA-directed RNA polymerase subunit RPC12/RpoP